MYVYAFAFYSYCLFFFFRKVTTHEKIVAAAQKGNATGRNQYNMHDASFPRI